MRRLIIKNLGPIKHIDININKVNVFMGPQSSGKSTIAKVISFCTWLDKQRNNDTVYKNAYRRLAVYHRLESYFTLDTEIIYYGENIVYIYKEVYLEEYIETTKGYTLIWRGEKDRVYNKGSLTNNPKVIYIPAERNFVSSVPNLSDYAEDDDNLLDFVKSWYDAKRKYTKSTSLNILNLGVNYFTEDGVSDNIVLDSGKTLALASSSSGIQSIVPLFLLVNWLSKGIYENQKPYSHTETKRLEELLENLSETTSKEIEVLRERLMSFVSGRIYTHTQFIIEEPEQNLFPETQKELLYYLISSLNHGKNHDLVITTHSPYILYAINNCMLGYIVKDNISEDDNEIKSFNEAWISPETVSIWELRDGEVVCIQDKDSGLIKGNYFDKIMNNIIADFRNLLNYY